MEKSTVLVLILSLCLFIGTISAVAKTLTVDPSGGDYRTIQDAVDAAAAGDRVLVESGVYVENVLIDKSIQMIGQERVVLRPADRGIPAITVTQEELASIQNLTIERADVGISITGKCLIANCDITASEIGIEAIVFEPNIQSIILCSFRGFPGIGVQLIGSGQAYLLQCNFKDLSLGVMIGGAVNTSVLQCTIESCFEGIAASSDATVTLLECALRDNAGNAIRLARSPVVTGFDGQLYIIDNVIENNGKWAISLCGINGDEPTGVFGSIQGSGNMIAGNGFGIACPEELVLPEGFLREDKPDS